MRKKLLKTVRFLVFLALGVLLLFLAFRDVVFADLKKILLTADYSWILLSFMASLLAFASRARRWDLLIHTLGHKPGFWNTYHAMMTGYLANFALPRVGEITKCVALSRKEKIPVDELFGTVIVERVIDMITLLVIMMVLLLTRARLFGDFLNHQVYIPLRDKFTGVFGFSLWGWILLAGLFLLALLLVILWWKQLMQFSLMQKSRNFVLGIWDGLKSFTRIRRKGEFLLHTLFMWLNYGIMTWVIVFTLESTSRLGLTDGVFLLVIGGLGMAAPVQGGIGAYHWIISRGLLHVYDIPLENGLAYATIAHESQFVLIVLLGTVSFLALYLTGRRPGKLPVESYQRREKP